MRAFDFHQFITHVSSQTKQSYVTLSLDPTVLEGVSAWDVQQALPMLDEETADDLATDCGLVIECSDEKGHALVSAIIEVFDSIPPLGFCCTLHTQGHAILHFQQGESQEIVFIDRNEEMPAYAA